MDYKIKEAEVDKLNGVEQEFSSILDDIEYILNLPEIGNKLHFQLDKLHSHVDFLYTKVSDVVSKIKVDKKPLLQLKDLVEYDAVRCGTKEIDKQFRELLHESGFTWHGGGSYKISRYSQSRYYVPKQGMSINKASVAQYNLLQATDFLP